MKTLSILRHAKSSWENTSLDDFDRPILSKGFVRTQKVCKYMLNMHLKPDCILSSPALRAFQTANIVIEELNLSLVPQICKNFYPGGVDEILDEISKISQNIEHVMVVGHNPVLTDLFAQVCEELDIEWLPTSSLATLEFEISDWKELKGKIGVCTHYAIPKEL
jgi:phosphohistidine phosphatase